MGNAAPEPPVTAGEDTLTVSPQKTLIAGALLFAAGALTFPFAGMALGPPGIDAGWQWMVNVATTNGWTFGRDIVFTYGPLGWLATPLDFGSHLVAANCFRILLHILLFGTVLHQLVVRRRAAPVIAFSLLWPAAVVLGLRFEGTVFLVVAALGLHSLRTRSHWPALAAGAVSGVVAYTKTSLMLTTGATLVIAAAVAWKTHGIRRALAGPAAALTAGAICAALFFPSFSVLFNWLLLSREVVQGYAAAASIIGHPTALYAGALLLLGCVAAAVTAARSLPGSLATTLVLAPSLLVSFRLAFVRQDGHHYLFVPFVIAVLAIAVLASERWRVVAGLIGAGAGVIIFGTLTDTLPFSPAEVPSRLLVGHKGLGNIVRLTDLAGTRSDLAAQSAHNLELLRLPESWKTLMQQAPNGISAVPWELMYGVANDLKLKPPRCTQLYAGHTERLDRWTAEGFTDADAPDYVLDDFAPMGKRRALLDTPLTWRTLFLGYDLLRYDSDRYLLLLRRRHHTRTHRWHDLGTSTIEVDAPGLAVPQRTTHVFAEIEAPLNLFGRLNRSFFRIPMLLTVFHRADGSVTWTRLIPATSVNGILVNHYPHDITDYAGLWLGRSPLEVTRLQIVGPGKSSYRRDIAVRWRELELVREE